MRVKSKKRCSVPTSEMLRSSAMSITSLHVDAARQPRGDWWACVSTHCLRSQSARGQVDQLWRDLTVTCRLWALAQRGSPHGHGPRTLSQSMQQRTVLTECIGIGWSPWQDGPTDNKNRWYKWCIRKLLLARVSANHFVQRWTWSFATQRSFHSCVAEFFFTFQSFLKFYFYFSILGLSYTSITACMVDIASSLMMQILASSMS